MVVCRGRFTPNNSKCTIYKYGNIRCILGKGGSLNYISIWMDQILIKLMTGRTNSVYVAAISFSPSSGILMCLPLIICSNRIRKKNILRNTFLLVYMMKYYDFININCFESNYSSLKYQFRGLVSARLNSSLKTKILSVFRCEASLSDKYCLRFYPWISFHVVLCGIIIEK